MNVKFNFIVHDNRCEGDCSYCRLNVTQLAGLYPMHTRIFTHHVDKNRDSPDWEGVQDQYGDIFELPAYDVTLPPNYHQILNADNYEFLMRTWNEKKCSSVVEETHSRISELNRHIDDVRSEITAETLAGCSSNIKKKECFTEKRNIEYRCGRRCKTKIFNLCVDYHGVYCNRVEDFAVCQEVEDFDAQLKEIKACHEKKAYIVKTHEDEIERTEKKKKAHLEENPYHDCMRIMAVE